MVKLNRKYRLVVLVMSLFVIGLVLSACGSDNNNGNNGLSNTENNNQVNEGNTGTEDGEANNEGGETTGFPAQAPASISFEPAEQIKRLAVFDYISGAEKNQRIEWLGEDEQDGVRVDKYHIIYNSAYESLVFEAWMDDNFDVVHLETLEESQKEVLEAYVPSYIESILDPLVFYDKYYRKNLVTGDGELISHTTEEQTLGSETLTVHTIFIYDDYTKAEYKVFVAEDEYIEIYLDLEMVKGEEGQIKFKTTINELKFR